MKTINHETLVAFLSARYKTTTYEGLGTSLSIEIPGLGKRDVGYYLDDATAYDCMATLIEYDQEWSDYFEQVITNQLPTRDSIRDYLRRHNTPLDTHAGWYHMLIGTEAISLKIMAPTVKEVYEQATEIIYLVPFWRTYYSQLITNLTP